MITPSDPEYVATKQIKLGLTRLAPPFAELAQWISATRNVHVLNVIYERANELHAPRLEVILEHDHEAQQFHCGANFDRDEQRAVSNKFLEIIARDDRRDFDVKGLFVVFSAFSPIAREEANGRITEDQIQDLIKRIANPELWEISTYFVANITFFFFTTEQKKRHEANGSKAEYSRMYFALLKPNDEFGYLSEKDFEVNFDSKQILDARYHGNLCLYHR